MRRAPKAPRPPTPLADLFDALLDGALGLLLLVVVVDVYAPPQDLPWRPLRLDDPIGLATAEKLDALDAAPGRCHAFLQATGIDVRPARSPEAEGACAVPAPVRPTSGFAPAGPLMACGLAARVSVWTQAAVRPQARRLLGADVTTIEHAGTYACRGVRATETEPLSRDPSTHARAEAIDVSGFRLSNGETVEVGRDWPADTARGRFLHAVRQDACRVFHTTLSPDYNAAHAGHLHLDAGPIRFCS